MKPKSSYPAHLTSSTSLLEPQEIVVVDPSTNGAEIGGALLQIQFSLGSESRHVSIEFLLANVGTVVAIL